MIRNILAIAIASALTVSAYAAASIAPESLAQQTALQKQINQLQSQISQLQNSLNTAEPISDSSSIHILLDDAKNVLFETFPSANNFGLALLKAKNNFKVGDVIFGGYIEQDTQYWHGDVIRSDENSSNPQYEKGSQVAITTLKLDAMSNLNNWTTSFISLSAGNLSNSDSSAYNNMQIAKAFLLIGNLQESPIYSVLGKTYLPFGSFGGGGPWTAPLDRMYFRPSETTQARLSYFQDGLNTNLALFNGLNKAMNDFVYGLNYSQTQGQWTYNFGASYLNDLRALSSYSDMGGRLYAVDVNAGVAYGLYSFNTEYVQGNHAIATNSGKPAAWNFTGTYSPTIASKLTMFSLSRDVTTQLANVSVGLAGDAVPGATALDGLRNQWTASVDREFFNNIFIGLELESAETYAAQNTYTATIDLSVYF